MNLTLPSYFLSGLLEHLPLGLKTTAGGSRDIATKLRSYIPI